MAVIVTGGSKGIGRDVALAFSEAGRTVLINYHSDDTSAQKTADEIRAEGATPIVVRADVGSLEGCRTLAHAVAETGERAEMLVHCAVDPYASACLDADPVRFTQAVNTNSISLLYLVQAFDDLLDRGSTVFFFSSRGGRIVINNYAAIGVGKAASEALIRYLATELAPRGIRVNSVAPSIVETDAVKHIFGQDATRSLMEHAAADNPSGRAVEPQDYCDLIRYLASPAASFITGQVVYVNGGANLSA